MTTPKWQLFGAFVYLTWSPWLVIKIRTHAPTLLWTMRDECSRSHSKFLPIIYEELDIMSLRVLMMLKSWYSIQGSLRADETSDWKCLQYLISAIIILCSRDLYSTRLKTLHRWLFKRQQPFCSILVQNICHRFCTPIEPMHMYIHENILRNNENYIRIPALHADAGSQVIRMSHISLKKPSVSTCTLKKVVSNCEQEEGICRRMQLWTNSSWNS